MAVDFRLDSYDVDLNYPGLGLKVWTTDVLDVPFGPEGFSLDVGESLTVDLFRIGTSEPDIDWDDWIPYTASVSLEFFLPTEASGHVWGITGGGYFGRRIGEQGYVLWDNPLEIEFHTGEVLEVSLSHERFGVPGSAIVEATFKLTAGGTGGNPPIPTPEPSSIALLTIGAGALLVRRRKRA
jgi:hypothetical protein